jgi:hypothetical protein
MISERLMNDTRELLPVMKRLLVQFLMDDDNLLAALVIRQQGDSLQTVVKFSIVEGTLFLLQLNSLLQEIQQAMRR